jgi:aspartyl/asparaginyl beta-hydroxylase (cupin superfamily)
MATKFWKRPGLRRTRRLVLAAIVFGGALYLVPIVALIYIVCGLIDVSRHQRITAELLEKYFLGNGIGTWLISPVNLLADLLSHRNKGVFRLEDLPAEHRREIETCVRAFIENGDAIKSHIAAPLTQNKRCMLTFKWYNARQDVDLRIPAFEREYRHIKTIAVSAFNTRERTSWHFGPLRFTFRVLYNLEPVDSKDVFIEVDNQTHYWIDNPLFIFDDTMFHRSINDVEIARYCLFMDIVRPNYFESLFGAAVLFASVVASTFKRVFYKNWSFIR